jgi:hypothetical protein
MFRDGTSHPVPSAHSNPRSLLDRVGGPAGRNGGNGSNGFAHDDIQSRIDDIVNSSDQNMMMAGGFSGMAGAGGMDMNTMAGMANPIIFQEMMMNQMALMHQMATMINGSPGQFVPPGFPMPGVMPGDMSMFPGGGMNNGFQGSMQLGGNGMGGRGRGSARGGRGSGRGRGGLSASSPTPKVETAVAKDASTAPAPLPIVAPTPTAPEASESFATTHPTFSAAPTRSGFAVPDRPQSPTLCKFNMKCTNAHCRYAHPSPVATAESGVVLSNEACEKGKDCQDKDCIKGHVSPAALNPQGVYHHVHNICLISVNSSVRTSTPAARDACRPISQSCSLSLRRGMYSSRVLLWPSSPLYP